MYTCYLLRWVQYVAITANYYIFDRFSELAFILLPRRSSVWNKETLTCVWGLQAHEWTVSLHNGWPRWFTVLIWKAEKYRSDLYGKMYVKEYSEIRGSSGFQNYHSSCCSKMYLYVLVHFLLKLTARGGLTVPKFSWWPSTPVSYTHLTLPTIYSV